MHDPNGARFYVRSSKTDAGVREVHMTSDLLQALIEHRDRLRHARQRTGQYEYVVPNRRGIRLDRQRVREIVTHGSCPCERTRPSGDDSRAGIEHDPRPGRAGMLLLNVPC
jgi:hypothetical protein